MPKRKKLLLTGLASICALFVFIMTILPLIVRNQAVKAIEQETGRTVRIEKVSINPFTLTATVKGFALLGADGGPFVSVGSMRASLGLASIYRRALILSEVTIDAPSLVFSRLNANTYSFNDIIERLKAKPKKDSGEFHFSINNISIQNGSLDFNDQGIAGGKKHTIRELKIAVPFISNIPYLIEKYTDPHISALVNGAPFKFDGKVKPLSKSLETSVHIDLRQILLPEYIAYIPTPPPVNVPSGKLSIDADITYRIHSDKKPQLHIKGLVRLVDLAVNLKNGKPLLKLPLLETKASLLEVLARKFAFESIQFDGLELFASRNASGEWMFTHLLPPHAKPGEKNKPEIAAGEKTASPGNVQIQVADFSFRNGMLHFSDALPPGGFKSEITQIDASVRNFSTTPDTKAEYEFSMFMDNDATFSTDGIFSLAPLKVTLSSELSDLKLQTRWPYLAQWLTAPLKGTASLQCDATYSREDGLAMTNGGLIINGLSGSYGDREGFDLARIEVKGAGYSQKKNSLEVSQILLSKGNISVSREEDGSISLLSLLKKSKPSSATPAVKTDLPGVAAAKAVVADSAPTDKTSGDLTYRIGKVQVDRLNASFTDKTVKDRPRFTLTNSSLTLSNLAGPKFTPAAVRFSSTFNKATPVKVTGDITPLPFRYKGAVSVGRLPLRDFDAYFPSNINVFLLGGALDTDMTLDVSLKDGKPFGSFKGSSGIRGFHAIDTVAEEDLLKWESLQLDDIQGNLEPFSLSLRQIALNGVYSRIIIRKDGTLNLQTLVEKPEGQGQGSRVMGQGNQSASTPGPSGPLFGALPLAPSKTPAAQQAAANPRSIRIEAVTIQDGTLSFTDNHLPQRFTTTFYNLGGRVSGLSSEDTKFADVDLRGNLQNHSPLQISGRINPLRDDLFVDLKVSFRDIELSPATPYSGTFLGYTIEKGKLFLDLKYHIDKKQLNSENVVFIDQFTFGEKVESDKATKLPVKLGLALLKDRKGEIHLDLPVTGRTDDPKFSIWGVVWQVVKNLMVKAVTSPFALLSSMMGGGQDFSAIQFAVGTSVLSTGEEQKLTSLAKALLDRPALKMELKGYVDRDRDTEGYRNELLIRKLRHEKFLTLSTAGTLKDGEKEDFIKLQPEEYATYLAPVYKKEKFPKPRNMLGFVKDLPPEEMKKLIITNTVIGEVELQTLARERIAAVKNHLVTQGGVAADRIFEKNDNLFKAPEKENISRSRVELNAIVQ